MSLSAMDLSHESSLGFSQNPSLFLAQVKVMPTWKHMVELYVNYEPKTRATTKEITRTADLEQSPITD